MSEMYFSFQSFPPFYGLGSFQGFIWRCRVSKISTQNFSIKWSINQFDMKSKLHPFLTPCEKGIEDMLKEADKNGDGQVNIDGFLSVMDP